MKIYHTETQEDYDALMVELESDGVAWRFGALPTKENNWKARLNNMCVAVSHQVAEYGSVDTYLKIYPETPIIKYKAKADEKMKFTKENVEKVIDEYFLQADFESCGDLIAEINNLDDNPEKVIVPKFVADWIELCKEKANLIDCLQGGYRHFNGYEHIGEDEDWLFEGNNQEVVARAWIDGYTIEPEQLYYIPLPHLETAGGTKQYLTKSGAGNYFALSPCIGQKQRYTKEELKQVPEIYKPYAKLIEEATE